MRLVWFRRVLWAVFGIGLAQTLVGLAATVYIGGAPWDKVWVMITFGGCASVIWRRQPQFAAVLAIIAAGYAEPILARADTTSLHIAGAVPLVLWAIAAQHLPRISLVGSATSAALWVGSGSTGLLYAILVLSALVLVLIHAVRAKAIRLGWFVLFMIPVGVMLLLGGLGENGPDGTYIETLTNCCLGLAPLGCLVLQQLPKRESEHGRPEVSAVDS